MGKAGLWAVDRYRNLRTFFGKPRVSPERIRRARKLYPGEEPEELLRRQDGQTASRIGMVLLAGGLLCGVLLWPGGEREEILELERPEYGKRGTVYELEAEKEDGVRLSLEVEVPERTFTRAEAEKRLEAAYEEICQRMLGDNESAEHVEWDLELPEKTLDGLVRAEWISRSRELFNDWGEILKKPGELLPEGERGVYELSLSCGGYECQYEIGLTVYPAEQTEEEKLLAALETELEKGAEDSGQRERLILPKILEGEPLTWFQKTEEGVGVWFLGLLPSACVLLVARVRQREKEKLKEREQEMLMDYPELVSKFTVLLQAGLAARNVWERMVAEYEEQKQSGKKPRYAYEEMKITWNQMKNGMYESLAYGEFGRRCGLHVYMKFGALLEQNLRQGTTGLALRLKEEAESAFEERKNLARRMGEEAETRLMLPMFMMLFMVLTVIMVPAFLSF